MNTEESPADCPECELRRYRLWVQGWISLARGSKGAKPTGKFSETRRRKAAFCGAVTDG